MKIDKLIQSLLFAMALVGVFAAMARNAYGFTLMGAACLGLASLYLILILWVVVSDFSTLGKKGVKGLVELFLLAVFLFLFGFRAFYIYVPQGEFIFLATSIVLTFNYLHSAYAQFTEKRTEQPALSWNLIFLYTSVSLFLLSLGTSVFTRLSPLVGLLGLLVALPFIFSILTRRSHEIQGKVVSLFQVVVHSKNKAGILLLFFLSMVIYVVLTSLNVIPLIENASQPKAYIELISDAERGNEKAVDGKYQHEKYKEAMGTFLERHGNKK